jgi:TAG lipase / steryl ester hydrolase / phospholipase A2 / LPA acyltransferase
MMSDTLAKTLKPFEQRMAFAGTYDEWCAAAQAYDELSGAERWKRVDQTRLYDFSQIRLRLDELRRHRRHQDSHALMFALNEGIHGNMGGMGRASLYQRAKFGTKHLIEDYVSEIVDALEHLAQLDESIISREEKLDFFNRARHSYGRTALMLSGGGAWGHFHIGVVKVLIENNVLPNVISGSSAGSLVTAVVGTHTDRELEESNHAETLVREAKKEAKWINTVLLGERSQINVRDLEQMVERLVPDMTFQEALELTGRHINISVAPADLHQTSRLLNAIASPNVYIRTAVMASCAVPGVYPPVMLQAKNIHGKHQPYLPNRRWVDGSVTDDLPAKRLARLYGVNFYIASLINPIILMSKDIDDDQTPVPRLLRLFLHQGATSLAKLGNIMSKKYTPDWPRLNLLINMFNSLLNQKYKADINIYADFRKFDLRKIMSHVSDRELMELERFGEIATWPQLERIKLSSKIGLALDRILEQYGEDEMRHVARKRKMKKKHDNRKTTKSKAA